jgi:hypothetical protein
MCFNIEKEEGRRAKQGHDGKFTEQMLEDIFRQVQ